MAKRASKDEVKQRTQIVAEMLIKGENPQSIIRYGSEKWDISDRQVETYISKSKRLIKKIFNQEKDYYKILLLARHEDLYKKNYNIQDYRECRQVLGDISKLIGAYIQPEENEKTISKIDQLFAALGDKYKSENA